MSTPCTRWDAAAGRHCGGTPTRLYPVGYRCATCTPAALTGRPEPQGGPCAPNRRYCPPGSQCTTCTRHQPIPQAAPDQDALFTQEAVAHA